MNKSPPFFLDKPLFLVLNILDLEPSGMAQLTQAFLLPVVFLFPSSLPWFFFPGGTPRSARVYMDKSHSLMAGSADLPHSTELLFMVTRASSNSTSCFINSSSPLNHSEVTLYFHRSFKTTAIPEHFYHIIQNLKHDLRIALVLDTTFFFLKCPLICPLCCINHHPVLYIFLS